jgi:hypothetical protein
MLYNKYADKEKRKEGKSEGIVKESEKKSLHIVTNALGDDD